MSILVQCVRGVLVGSLGIISCGYAMDDKFRDISQETQNSLKSLMSANQREEWWETYLKDVDDYKNLNYYHFKQALTSKLSNLETSFSSVKGSKAIHIVEPFLSEGGNFSRDSKEKPYPINYHLYVPKNFKANFEKGLTPPVIIKVYGGGCPDDFSDMENYLLSTFGCIVFTLVDEDNDIIKVDTHVPLSHVNYTNFPKELFKNIRRSVEFLKKEAPQGPYIIPGKTKVFLSGGSFGGYVAMLAATDVSETNLSYLFDGFISDAGVYDWSLVINDDTVCQGQSALNRVNNFDFSRLLIPQQTINQSTYYFTKNYLKDENYNQEVSPVYHLKNLHNPMLVLHGLNDIIVFPTQVLFLLEKARIEGKDFLFRTRLYKNQSHFCSNVTLEVINRYNDIMTFIEDVIVYGGALNHHLSFHAQSDPSRKRKEMDEDLSPESIKKLNEALKRVKRIGIERSLIFKYITLDDLNGINRIANDFPNKESLGKFINTPIYNPINKKKELILNQAICKIRNDIIVFLLNAGANPNHCDSDGFPLQRALCEKNMEAFKLLIDHKADISQVDKNGFTPLHQAAIWEEDDYIEVLLENGANVFAKDNRGWLPVYASIVDNKINTVALFIKYGVSPSDLVHFTAAHGTLKMMQFLVQQGANMTYVDDMGQTVLHSLASREWLQSDQNPTELAEWLIENKSVDLNAQGKTKKTPLMQAAQSNNTVLMKLLIKAGVDVNISDCDGKIPLFYAWKHGNNEIQNLLVKHGSKPITHLKLNDSSYFSIEEIEDSNEPIEDWDIEIEELGKTLDDSLEEVKESVESEN